MPSFLWTTALIGIFSILAKLLGLARDFVFANRFGAGEIVDIYVAGFRVPDLVYSLLVMGTLSVAFIPVFVRYLGQDKKEAFVIASTIFNLTFLVMGLIALLGLLYAPILVKLIVPGFSQEASLKTAALTRILMLSPLLFSLSSVLTSVLHSFKRFMLAAIAPLFYNAAIIFGVLFVYPRYGLSGIAWAVVGGAFLHFLLQFPSAFRLGLRPFRDFALRHAGVKKIGKLFVPRIFGIDLGQISLLSTSVIGSFLAPGSIAIFYFAYNLETVPLGIFALSFAITSFPVMTEYFAKNDVVGFKNFFSRTTVQLSFLIIPMSILMLLLRAQIVRLILGAVQNTHFTFGDTRLTAQALGFFALSLFAQSLVPLLGRCFYAMQNTIIPVVSGLFSTAFNIGLAVVFAHYAGAAYLALAFSIAITLHMLIMLLILRHRLGDLNDNFLILRILKISAASVIMGIATFVTLYLVAPLVNMQTYLGVTIQTIAASIVALATYLGAGFLINLPEAHQLLTILRNWFFKFTRPITTAISNTFTGLK